MVFRLTFKSAECGKDSYFLSERSGKARGPYCNVCLKLSDSIDDFWNRLPHDALAVIDEGYDGGLDWLPLSI
jgi:hypothetical protein